jgi:Flp pilus assembly protein TadG
MIRISPSLIPDRRHGRERGGVAVLVALVLAVLVGFAGIVLDLGRLFVNKTELQNAADACALAAANQLVCDPSAGPCPAAFLEDAEAAGIFVAARNTSDFQDGAVTIAPGDVKFHTAIGPNSAYLARTDGANANSKFAMCTARSAAISTRFMQVLQEFTPSAVEARAVATLAPGQTACNASPVGVCSKPGSTAPNYGYSIGEWIVSSFNRGTGGNDDTNLEGNFRWVDFTPNAGGANEVRDQLLGNGSVCGIRVGDDVREQGVKQGAKSAWNTRFGIYPNGANAPSPAAVAPDKTGYAYPSKAPGTVVNIGQSAYADYRAKQASHTPFSSQSYAPTGAAGNVNGNQLTQAEHLTYGAERRLMAVPVLQCGSAPAAVSILTMGCVLMLNPMSNGATGDLYLEWRGLASAAGSPCRSAGVAGGTNGPLVPTLVQ